MAEAQKEQTLITNEFGTITDKRVVFYPEKDWFKGGTLKDMSLKQIKSVEFKKTRSIAGGILFIALGIVTFHNMVGSLPLAIGILLIWGSPTITIETNKGELSKAKGWPWQDKIVMEYVEVLSKQLASKQ